MKLASFGSVLLLVVLAAGCSGDSDSGTLDPSCSGEGCGSCDATACTCGEPGPCQAVCGDECELTCSGTKGCTGRCGEGCDFTCSGEGECIAIVGANSTITCSGTNGCAISCEGGGCHAVCNGPHGCELDCAGDDCLITSCSAGMVACADGIFVCGRPCP